MHAQAPAAAAAAAACRSAGMQQHCRLCQLLSARLPALQPCMQLLPGHPPTHTPQRSVGVGAHRLLMHAQAAAAAAAAACRCAGMQQHCRLCQLLSARLPALQPCMQLPTLHPTSHTPQRSVGMEADRLLMHAQAATATGVLRWHAATLPLGPAAACKAPSLAARHEASATASTTPHIPKECRDGG